jgi:hypothetical protein
MPKSTAVGVPDVPFVMKAFVEVVGTEVGFQFVDVHQLPEVEFQVCARPPTAANAREAKTSAEARHLNEGANFEIILI